MDIGENGVSFYFGQLLAYPTRRDFHNGNDIRIQLHKLVK